MAAWLALPKSRNLAADEVAATFVVPAPRGCNLNCAFCFIRMRREAPPEVPQLAERHYLDFLEELNRQSRVRLVSLQGYEPLLPESWPYSEALLRKAQDLGIETALITNGTFLADRISDLMRLDVKGITVSVDSADPKLHDRSRGTPGAFAATLDGLRKACASELADRILVASVLQRGKADYLFGMPRLLRGLGMQEWVVSPLYKVGRTKAGGPSDDHYSIVFQMMRLSALAKEQGIQLILDDEFNELAMALRGVNIGKGFLTRQLMRSDQVIRLSPEGTCSVGDEILWRADTLGAVWKPDIESAGSLVERVLARRNRGESSLSLVNG